MNASLREGQALSVSRAFIDHIMAGRQKKIVSIFSVMGSLAETVGRSGGFYFYRISKAGLNMAMRALQADVRNLGIIVAMLHPGAVDTRMYKQTGFLGRTISPGKSVSGMMNVIESLTSKNSGSFLRYDGRRVAW